MPGGDLRAAKAHPSPPDSPAAGEIKTRAGHALGEDHRKRAAISAAERMTDQNATRDIEMREQPVQAPSHNRRHRAT